MSTITTSQKYTINWKDLTRGLLIAVITAVLTSAYEAITQCGIECIDWKQTAGIGLAAGISYLIKNFFTPSEIVLQNPSPSAVEQVKKGEAEIKVMTKQ